MQQADYPDLYKAYRRIEALAGRFSYKPNWVFEVEASPESGCITLGARMKTADSTGHPHGHRMPGEDDPDSYIVIAKAISFPWQTVSEFDEGILVQQIFDLLVMGLERHEAEEWFRLDGRAVYDPHDEKAGSRRLRTGRG